MKFRLICRNGITVVRALQGCNQRPEWVEFPVEIEIKSQSSLIEKKRVSTKVAIEVALAAKNNLNFYEEWDTMYLVTVGKSAFLLIETRGSGFDYYDGDFWYPFDASIREGIEEVKFGKVVWEPCKLPL